MHVIDQSVAAGSRTLASMAVRAGDVREINQREWRGCGFGGLFFPRFLGGFLACRPDSEQIDFVCLHVTLPKKKKENSTPRTCEFIVRDRYCDIDPQ